MFVVTKKTKMTDITLDDEDDDEHHHDGRGDNICGNDQDCDAGDDDDDDDDDDDGVNVDVVLVMVNLIVMLTVLHFATVPHSSQTILEPSPTSEGKPIAVVAFLSSN